MSESPEHRREAGESMTLLEVFQVLLDRRRLVTVVTVVCVAVAIAYALVAPQRFQADAVVTEVGEQALGGSLGGLDGQLGGLATLAGLGVGSPKSEALPILKSRALVERFITRHQLIPALFADAPAGQPPSIWKAVDLFQRDVLRITEDPKAGVVRVTVTWRDPVQAAEWANGFVALANEVLRERAVSGAERNLQHLRQQVARTDAVELQRALYSLMESESKTLMLASAREEYAFVVVDRAVAPELRVSPKRRLIVMLGAVLGLFLGAGLALIAHLGGPAWRNLRVSRG